ncbi:hypothetical protein ACFWUQ_14860 [Streptomyces sp. NPDC058662]|uniref:hypothetical protein n=1 Tax=Streptomyces sp. NPDC058662 TaxID=3346583 RepID=UPI00364E3B39
MIAETVCAAVSAAGLGVAALTAYRKRFRTAVRIAAYALVPIGLVLTGAVAWVSGMIFNPAVWAGFGLLGLAWLLLVVTRAAERRAAGRAVEGAPVRGAVAPAASRPATGPGAAPPRSVDRGARKDAPAGEDFSDIEAILKKHGI